MLILCVEEL